MPTIRHVPETVYRTGTQHFTITEAHPYHRALTRVDHKGAGTYIVAYDPHCVLCRAERDQQETTA